MQILDQVALASRTTLGVGGPAQYFIEADSDATLIEALTWADGHGVKVALLGGGSNVVVADAGFDGLVIHVGTRGINWNDRRDAGEVTARAGEPWDDLVALCVDRGWSGVTCLSGIPGQVGATPIQNVGAYGQEVGQCIAQVRAFDRRHGEIVELAGADCHFGYRDSRFKSEQPDRYVVLDVTFRLRPGAPPEIRGAGLAAHLRARNIEQPTLADVRESVLSVRREKSMLADPGDPNGRSCGSFFVNPVVAAEQGERLATAEPNLPRWPLPDGRVKLAAAWLIEHAGFARGTRAGAVGLSTQHALALVCHAGARADDVVTLARRIRAAVEARFGVRLVPEPSFWGFSSLDDRLPDDRIA